MNRYMKNSDKFIHCDAKLLVSGNFALPNAKDSTFVLPNAKNTNMLVSLALGDANFSCHQTQNPQRESVEYRLRWVPNAKSSSWPCIFHVVCVNFICVRWPTQKQFSVEYGYYFLCRIQILYLKISRNIPFCSI